MDKNIIDFRIPKNNDIATYMHDNSQYLTDIIRMSQNVLISSNMYLTTHKSR